MPTFARRERLVQTGAPTATSVSIGNACQESSFATAFIGWIGSILELGASAVRRPVGQPGLHTSGVSKAAARLGIRTHTSVRIDSLPIRKRHRLAVFDLLPELSSPSAALSPTVLALGRRIMAPRAPAISEATKIAIFAAANSPHPQTLVPL